MRCLVRDPSRLEGRAWHGRVEVVTGDILQPADLATAMRGVEVVYYLVHSMGAGPGFHTRDIDAAARCAAAAAAAGVRRIIYLGGLASASPELSEHLRSRLQTGDALRSAGVPVTEFRASVIVGSGSLSFEMVRYLAERLPVMICPRWVYTRTQPIGIDDVLAYLTAAPQLPESAGRVVEIGGATVVTYREMMMVYAEVRGLRRVMIPVPVLTPRLSSYWVNLVTPIPASIARPLIEGLRNESVVRDRSAAELFPGIRPAPYRAAVEAAVEGIEGTASLETSWSDALSTSHRGEPPVVLTTQEGMIVERRQQTVSASPEVVYQAFSRLGGRRGWLYMNWAWRIRGFMDRLFGGVGLRRGRRDPNALRVGDALDFWRVEAVEPGRLIRLRAEMKVPGKAWLQFQVSPGEGGGTLLAQTAFFAPRGLAGWIYWYALYPFHALIFSGLIARVGQSAATSEPRADS